MKSFYIHKLGCPKNDVDADYLAGYLIDRKLRPVDSPEEADLLIVNTCGFIGPAKEESIEAIMQMTTLKQTNRDRKLILTGCLSQRYASILADEMPEVDGIFGITSVRDIENFMENPDNRQIRPSHVSRTYQELSVVRKITKAEPYAYIKISDGCDNRCSYCAIPDIRGPYRSRRIEAIIDEAAFLLDSGKRELILVSQESTAYGTDIYKSVKIIELVDKITSLKHDFWLRIMYLHPARLTRELVDYMIDNPKICSYFDIPLQHISERILSRMHRRVGQQQIEGILEYIKGRDPKAAIRTSFIVGFPGETEQDFNELCRFVEKRRFERMGTFVYSPEENTPAEAYADHVGESTRNQRVDDLMLLQQNIAFERNSQTIGETLQVITDSYDTEQTVYVGRSPHDAPEIDQTVRFEATGVKIGDILPITITGYDGYDLLGKRGIS